MLERHPWERLIKLEQTNHKLPAEILASPMAFSHVADNSVKFYLLCHFNYWIQYLIEETMIYSFPAHLTYSLCLQFELSFWPHSSVF